jgi:hypothetical protein
MSKYEPLAQFLAASAEAELDLTFEQVEASLGARLPPSASTYREWWANDSSHSQSKAWMAVGWQVWKVDFDRRRVQFRRTGDNGSRGPGRPAGYEKTRDSLTIPLDGISGAAMRLIDDYAEENRCSRDQAAASILNATGLERRRAMLEWFQSRWTGKLGSDSVDLIREDRDAR